MEPEGVPGDHAGRPQPRTEGHGQVSEFQLATNQNEGLKSHVISTYNI